MPDLTLYQFYVLKKTTMRSLNQILQTGFNDSLEAPVLRKRWEPFRIFCIWLLLLACFNSIYGSSTPELNSLACDNVTLGGTISGDELGCPSPHWDPSLIRSNSLPSGGSGTLEYIWMYTTDNPSLPLPMWVPIPNSNSPELDPGPISRITYYRRFSRRSGCSEYKGESNIVMKDASCCSNVTGGGLIGNNQSNCISPFDASEIRSIYLPSGGNGNLIFQWVYSTKTGTYTPGSPDWVPIPGATSADYDPEPVTKTTWFIRLSRRHGCSDFEGVSNPVKIAIESPVKVTSIEAKGVTCSGGNDGSITLVYEGAQFPVHFNWSPTIGNVKDPENLTSGTYAVTLSDAQGCMAFASVTVPEGSKINVGLSAKMETCLGAKDGTASVSWVTGGTPGYSYSWSFENRTGTNLSNLIPGTYSVTATDSKGCQGIRQVNVPEGPQLGITLQTNSESCLGAANGTASVKSVDGGTPGYNYVWSIPGSTGAPGITGIKAGSYSVTVNDARGCLGFKQFDIGNGPALEMTLISDPVKCSGDKNGKITVVSVAGGTAPYIYQWSNGRSSSSAFVSDLAAGNYQVVVKDAIGCTGSASAAVSEPAPLVIQLSSSKTTCSYTLDGAAQVTVTGGTKPYRYQWNNNRQSAAINNLSPGNYSVTVTDERGCSSTGSTLIEPTKPIKATVETQNVSCFGLTDAAMKVTISNNDGGKYRYKWSNGLQNESGEIQGLASGYYVVTVTNEAGCFTTLDATLKSPEKLSIDLTAQKISCYGNSDGVAIAYGKGGTPIPDIGYRYSWDAPGNPQGNQLGAVPRGNYSVFVTDLNGCSATANVNVDSPLPLSTEADVKSVSCNGLKDGYLKFIPVGGVAPYQFRWESGGSVSEKSNLAPGNYRVTITDANGCIFESNKDISEPPPLSVLFTKTDANCQYSNDGSITARVIGGTLPYSYSWSNAGNSAVQNSLSAATYNLTVTDAANCQITASQQVFVSSDLSAKVDFEKPTCAGGSDGYAIAKPTGGISPYSYKWSNGSIKVDVDNLSAGEHSVEITDASGCSVSKKFLLPSPSGIQCSVNLIKSVSKYGGTDALAVVSVSGAQGTLKYLWSNGWKQDTVSGLSKGIYTVTVTDSLECSCIATIEIANPSKIGDLVWDDMNQNGVQDSEEPGIENIKVTLRGENNIELVTTTDVEGIYSFDGLKPGKYQLEFGLPASAFYTSQHVGEPGKDSDADPITGKTSRFELGAEEFADRWDAGIIVLDEKVNIGDWIWEDANRNGLQDSHEKGIQGISVHLISHPSEKLISKVVSDVQGKYLFKDVLPGSYVIEFVRDSSARHFSFTTTKVSSDWKKDSDVLGESGRTSVFEVAPFTLDNLTIDAGLFQSCDNVTDGGRIGSNEAFCGTSVQPGKITNSVLPSGGQGQLQYIWMSGHSPVFKGQDDPNWRLVEGTVGAELQPSVISSSTFYVRLARRTGCTHFGAPSNIISKALSPVPLAMITGVSAEHCLGESISVEAVNAGSGSIYTWEFSGDATPTSGKGLKMENVKWSGEGFKNITLSVNRFGCSNSIVQTIRIRKCEPPLSFLNLVAQTQTDKVQVQWKTNTESANVIYFVQRADDGVTFENLGAVSGTQKQTDGSFRFTDSRPLFGENYYRISFKRNQESGNSEVIMAFVEPQGYSRLLLYPNPSQGNVTLELLKRVQESGRVEVSNLLGKVIFNQDIPLRASRVEVDLNHLENGIYLVKVKQKGLREQTVRLVIAKGT